MVHPDAVNLLKKMLEKNPEERATAETLIEDEWLTKEKPIDLFMLAGVEESVELS